MADLIRIEGANLIFRNFAGRPDDKGFNAAGDRNFGVILDEAMVPDLINDGWNVRRLNPRPDDPKDYPGTPWLKVKVQYYRRDGAPVRRPPIVEFITSRNRRKLNENTIADLDWCRIKNCDLIIRPNEYAPGKISAYLQSIYVVADEDDFAMKYADIPYSEDY